MLRFRLLLFITIVVLPNKPAIAFPHFHLSPRQGLDIWNNNVDWGKVGGTILTVIGGLGTALKNTLQPEEEEEDEYTTTTAPPGRGTLPGPASPGPLTSGSAQGVDLGQPTGEFIKPPKEDSVPSVSPPCDANIFSRDCGKVLDQVIFTTSCSTMSPDQAPTAIDIAQNAAILDELERVATGPVLTTTSDHCDVFMFVASLPAEESDRIRLLPGVLGVSSDTYLVGSKNQPQTQPGIMEQAFKRRQLRKRDRVRQPNAPANLAFISRSPNSPGISTDFLYDSMGGADTEVFYMGPGMAMDHPDFANNPITRDDFFFANDVRPNDTLDEDADGTCWASLISGNLFGVSKHTRLRPVRSNTRLSSLMNSMVQVLNYVAGRVQLPGPEGTGNGFVMVFTTLWLYEDQVEKARFEQLLGMLALRFGVVTVVPGEKGYYPSEYAKTYPVISVGAVDTMGLKFPWSPGRDEVTVTAPVDVLCASDDGGHGDPISIVSATAQAGGLAAYFLSLFPQLRAQEHTSLRVRNWMVSNSWARLSGGLPSIWNRMEPYTPDASGDEIPPNVPY